MTSSNALLEQARSIAPTIDRAIRICGDLTLNEYIKRFSLPRITPIQPAEDFLQLALEYNEDQAGFSTALELDRVLRYPLLNTANHHGVDYFPPSVQGNLLFWKALSAQGVRAKVLPVCYFGMVSLSNSSYARGLTSNASSEGLIRVPIYPEDDRNKMVRYVKAFTRDQIHGAIKRTKRNLEEGYAKQDLLRALEVYYLDEQVLSMDRYGDQAVRINRLISRDMFPQGDIPEIVSMEMEHIFKGLLLLDLENEDSLIYRLLYDSRLPEPVMFFWGVDKSHRRYMLEFGKDRVLRGTTMAGETVNLPAGPKELAGLVEREEVLAAAYTMAVLLCFARGYTWVGGYFQGDYLPEWQRLTIDSLSKLEEYRGWAEQIGTLDCSGYLSGPLFAMIRSLEGDLAPAGPLEIIRKGGLSHRRLEELMDATVLEAHVMGLSGSYPDLVRSDQREPQWRSLLRNQLNQSYERFRL